MSRNLKNEIFFFQSCGGDVVEFYRVTRSTTNTCEVARMKKTVIFQTEDLQYVEPDFKTEGEKSRCRILSYDEIEFKSGEIASLWDRKPVTQNTIIFLPYI